MTDDAHPGAEPDAALDAALDRWLAAWLGAVERRTTPSGAEIAFAAEAVAKVHHRRTRSVELAQRLRAVAEPGPAPWWVQPVEAIPRTTPDGRLVTLWPRVEVLTEDAPEHPWADAGRLLARLHRTPVEPPVLSVLPPQGGRARVSRALDRARRLDHPARSMLAGLGRRLVGELTGSSSAPPHVVHGDWHLGQLAVGTDRLRLLDVDDLGLGDPAWDLARPAGFWAAGALDDASWETFLDAYRDAGGPAVARAGDPWRVLDLPARCAVFVAAVRTATVQPAHSDDPAHSLLEACARM